MARTKSDFPTYKPGESCLKQGKKSHKFVARPSGKGAVCIACGSSISQKAWDKRNTSDA